MLYIRLGNASTSQPRPLVLSLNILFSSIFAAGVSRASFKPFVEGGYHMPHGRGCRFCHVSIKQLWPDAFFLSF